MGTVNTVTLVAPLVTSHQSDPIMRSFKFLLFWLLVATASAASINTIEEEGAEVVAEEDEDYEDYDYEYYEDEEYYDDEEEDEELEELEDLEEDLEEEDEDLEEEDEEQEEEDEEISALEAEEENYYYNDYDEDDD